jgi:hypothetical protein
MNGSSSDGWRSRHINIQYLWVKDMTKANNILIRHCPTLQMLADLFTNPLQVNLFRKFRDVLLGHKPTHTIVDSPLVQTEERVGEANFGKACGDHRANHATKKGTPVMKEKVSK